MKRIAILLTVLATALVMTVPAGAKKPPKPDDPPPPAVYYAAEITNHGIGIATTCTELVLKRNGIHFEWYSDGDDPLDDDPDLSEDMELHLSAPGLMWFGHDLTGCQDAGEIVTTDLDGSEQTVVGPGYFRVTLEEDDTVAMLWIFEIHQELEEVALNKKGTRTRLESTGRTDFRMGGPYDGDAFAKADSVTIDGETITISIVNRPFHFVDYDSEAHPMFVELTNGVQIFTLTISLTPCPATGDCTV